MAPEPAENNVYRESRGVGDSKEPAGSDQFTTICWAYISIGGLNVQDKGDEEQQHRFGPQPQTLQGLHKHWLAAYHHRKAVNACVYRLLPLLLTESSTLKRNVIRICQIAKRKAEKESQALMQWEKERSEADIELQELLKASKRLPRHIAIIMDGNGRWAQERGLPRYEGHREGIKTVRDIVKATATLGIEFLTLYVFSMENWKRPKQEVAILMDLLRKHLKKELPELKENNVRLQAIGKLNALPKGVYRQLLYAIEETRENTGLTLTLALSYSGRWDIVRAVQLIALDVRRGKLSPEDITEQLLSSYLLTADMPDPDLVIRTSGEMRLSNFLLWETAYSEIYVSRKYWPDFTRKDLYTAILDYLQRERRFGLTSEQIAEQRQYYQDVQHLLEKDEL